MCTDDVSTSRSGLGNENELDFPNGGFTVSKRAVVLPLRGKYRSRTMRAWIMELRQFLKGKYQ